MNAAIYARVSTLNGQSPEMQLRELREYCQRRGWTVILEYVDIGISGTKEKRPQLEKDKPGLTVTGKKEKILELLKLEGGNVSELVVEGDWTSLDRVRVSVSSVLAEPSNINSIVKTLLDEEPFRTWLPTYEGYETGEEYDRNQRPNVIPWITCPRVETTLDSDDPLGASSALKRPYFAKLIRAFEKIEANDPFGRSWSTEDRTVVAHAEAWGQENERESERDSSGTRLVCSANFLQDVLAKTKCHLLLLVKFELYQQSSHSRPSHWSNTIAVLHFKPSFDFEYHEGAINKVFELKH